jgi:hypothetical protein
MNWHTDYHTRKALFGLALVAAFLAAAFVLRWLFGIEILK